MEAVCVLLSVAVGVPWLGLSLGDMMRMLQGSEFGWLSQWTQLDTTLVVASSMTIAASRYL